MHTTRLPKMGAVRLALVAVATLSLISHNSKAVIHTNSATLSNCTVEIGPGLPWTLTLIVRGEYLLPLINSNHFTITNISMRWSGRVGAAAWKWMPSCDFDLYADALANADIGSSSNFANVFTVGIPLFVDTAGCQISRGATADLAPGFFQQNLPLSYYYAGGPLDGGGGVGKLFGEFRVSVNGSVGVPYPVPDTLPSGKLAFVKNSPLQVLYGIEPKSTGNSPPPDIVSSDATNQFIVQDFGGSPIPLPYTPDIPDEILSETSLYVKQIQPQGSDLLVTWNTLAGKTNYVQVETNSAAGPFGDLSGPIVATGTNMVSTNYLDAGAATNGTTRFYRIRFLP